MVLENKLGISNSVELAHMEEHLSKQCTIELFDSSMLAALELGAYSSLAIIHECLFADIYDFAGKMRDIEIKTLLKSALTEGVRARKVFMKSIDASYAYEGYAAYSASDL